MNCRSALVDRYILILTTFTLTSFPFIQARAFSSEPVYIKSNPDFLMRAIQEVVVDMILIKYPNMGCRTKLADIRPGEADTDLTYRLFNAAATSKEEAKLFWVTENEMNNDRFEVERSFDTENFNTIGLVFGPEDNVSRSNRYEFSDRSQALRAHKVAYYRLKQIDLDGKFSYSVVHTVRFNADFQSPSLNPVVEVFPNPSFDKINVSFKSAESGIAEVMMFDANGLLVETKQSIIKKSLNRIQLTDLTLKSTGVYVVDVIINGNTVHSQKIMKK